MDPLSQGVLGAALAQSAAKRESIKRAAFCGLIGGMAPDLDIFIRSTEDPLMMIQYHRHFTHSLAFIPFGGLIVALFLYWAFFRKKSSFAMVYLFTTLGMATHGLLDASTSYGTHLFWPFSEARISWNIISIIDPIFTFTLLIFCGLSLYRRSIFLMRVGLGLALCYLALGFVKHGMVGDVVQELAEQRGHTIDRMLLNPTIGNNFLWRTVYQSGEHYYVDAVYATLLEAPVIHEGTTAAVIDAETVFPEIGADTVQRADIHRFAHFSQDFIYLHPEKNNVIADLRYGTLPYDDKSLWGIEVTPEQPNRHVRFQNFRNFSDRHYEAFWLMLGGEFPKE